MKMLVSALLISILSGCSSDIQLKDICLDVLDRTFFPEDHQCDCERGKRNVRSL